MKWFRHPSDAHRSKGMMKLRQKYGAEGLGLYWYCVECIAAPIDKHNISFELEHDVEVLAAELKIDTLKCEEMMRFMCKPDVNLFVTDAQGGRVFCFYLAQMIENSIVKNPALKLVQAELKKLSGGQQVTIDDILALPGIVGNPGQSGNLPDLSGKPGPEVEGEGDTDTEATTTTVVNLYDGQALQEDWRPAPATIDSLKHDYCVPPLFVEEEYLTRFIDYWVKARVAKVSWQGLFIEQCQKQWQKERTTFLDGALKDWTYTQG